MCVGMKHGIREGLDSVITSYRAHGFAYMMGISVQGVLSELTGKVSGCVRGKVRNFLKNDKRILTSFNFFKTSRQNLAW